MDFEMRLQMKFSLQKKIMDGYFVHGLRRDWTFQYRRKGIP
jgi:hypothetical protein